VTWTRKLLHLRLAILHTKRACTAAASLVNNVRYSSWKWVYYIVWERARERERGARTTRGFLQLQIRQDIKRRWHTKCKNITRWGTLSRARIFPTYVRLLVSLPSFIRYFHFTSYFYYPLKKHGPANLWRIDFFSWWKSKLSIAENAVSIFFVDHSTILDGNSCSKAEFIDWFTEWFRWNGDTNSPFPSAICNLQCTRARAPAHNIWKGFANEYVSNYAIN